MTQVEERLAEAGVFKGAHGLEGLANATAFWEKQPYGTRLYYGDGLADYLHVGVLRSAIELLTRTPSPATGSAVPASTVAPSPVGEVEDALTADFHGLRQRIDLRFTSGNDVSVERASITIDEWMRLRSLATKGDKAALAAQAPKPASAGGETEFHWLVEGNGWYLSGFSETHNGAGFCWMPDFTKDPNEAMRFVTREKAARYANDLTGMKAIEHGWIAAEADTAKLGVLTQPGDHHPQSTLTSEPKTFGDVRGTFADPTGRYMPDPPAPDRLAQTVTDEEAYACRSCGNVWTGQLPDKGRLPLHALRCSCNPNSWGQFIKLRRPLPDAIRARESAPAQEGIREAVMRVMRVERDHAIEVFCAADGQSSPKTREEFKAAWDALNELLPLAAAPRAGG